MARTAAGRRRRFVKQIKKRAPSNKVLNQKIKKIQKSVELKWIDSLFDTTVANAGASLLLMNGITQGVDDNNRVGSDIRPTSIQFRFTAESNTAAPDNTIMRIIVFWDRQANGAIPITTYNTAVADLLSSATTEGESSSAITAPYNPNMADRYRILYDKTVTLIPSVVLTTTLAGAVTTSNTWVPANKTMKNKIKLSRKVTYNSGDNNLITSISSNSLYMVAYSDRAAQLPSLTFHARLYFKDA